MHSSATRLRGVLPAVITPYTEDGTIDEALFTTEVDYLAAAGVDGFFVAGTTAEGAYLTDEERVRLTRLVKERIEGRLCCVAALVPDTTAVLRTIDRLAPLEPDFVSAVTPFYMHASQSDLVHHFTTIADRSPVPLILYNIPQNSHNRLELATIVELAGHPNIAGIKDSAGVFMDYQRGLLATADDGFTWIQGEDLLDAPALLMGGQCIVTGLGNAWVEPYVAMYRAARAGAADRVVKEQARINSLAGIIFATGGAVIPSIKYASELQGRSSARMRVASMELSSGQKRTVAEVLRGIGLDVSG